MCPCVADWFSCVLVLQAGSGLFLCCSLVKVCPCVVGWFRFTCVAGWLKCVFVLQAGSDMCLCVAG